MGTTSSTTNRQPDDLTARARIRDAAMRMFADRGYAGTSMRAVAAEVGVSIGLVQHHFGSKAGLREACDEVAIGSILDDAREQSKSSSPLTSPMESEVDEVVLAYLGRALIDGSPTATKLFDSGSEVAESWMRDNWPDRFGPDDEGMRRARAAAAVMSAMHLGPIALHAHVSRRLGLNILERENIERIPAAITEVYRVMASLFDQEAENGGTEDE